MRQDMKRATTVLLAFLVLASLGCVTRGTYDELESDRDQLSNRLVALETANAEMEEELVALRARSAMIEEELRDEVVAGQIRIEEVQNGIRVDVSNQLLFGSGSANLSTEGREVLGRLAAQLRDGNETISVEGHTDNLMISKSLQSKYPNNWELAGARAARVVRRITAEGVDPTRVRAVSRGPFAPADSNDTEAGRARNRRTEIILRPPIN